MAKGFLEQLAKTIEEAIAKGFKRSKANNTPGGGSSGKIGQVLGLFQKVPALRKHFTAFQNSLLAISKFRISGSIPNLARKGLLRLSQSFTGLSKFTGSIPIPNFANLKRLLQWLHILASKAPKPTKTAQPAQEGGGEASGEGLNKILQNLPRTNKLFGNLGKSFGGMGKALGGVGRSVGGMFRVLGGLGKGLAGLGAAAGAAVAAVAAVVAVVAVVVVAIVAVVKVAKKLWQTFLKTTQWAEQFGQAVHNAAMQFVTFHERFLNFGGTIANMIRSYSPARAKQIEIAMGRLRAAMGQALAPATKDLTNLFINLAHFVKKLAKKFDFRKIIQWAVLGLVIAAIAAAVVMFGMLANTLFSFPGLILLIIGVLWLAWDDLKNTVIGRVIQALWEAGKMLWEFGKIVWDVIHTIGVVIFSVLSPIAKVIAGLFGLVFKVVTGVVKIIGAILSPVLGFVRRVFSVIGDQLNWIASGVLWIFDKAGKLIDWLTGAITGFIERVWRYISPLLDTIIEIAKFFVDVTRLVWNTIGQYIYGWWQEISGWISEFGNCLQGLYDNYIKPILDSAPVRNVTGAVNMLSEATDTLKSKVKGWLSWARQKLGLESAEEQPKQEEQAPQEQAKQQEKPKEKPDKLSELDKLISGAGEKLKDMINKGPAAAMGDLADLLEKQGLGGVASHIRSLGEQFGDLFNFKGTEGLGFEASEAKQTTIEDIGKQARLAALGATGDPEKQTAKATQETAKNTQAIQAALGGTQSMLGAMNTKQEGVAKAMGAVNQVLGNQGSETSAFLRSMVQQGQMADASLQKLYKRFDEEKARAAQQAQEHWRQMIALQQETVNVLQDLVQAKRDEVGMNRRMQHSYSSTFQD